MDWEENKGLRVILGDMEHEEGLRRSPTGLGSMDRSFTRGIPIEEDAQPKPDTSHLFPYTLYGCRSYFGLLETIEDTISARKSTVRCESPEGGVLLSVPKQDLQRFAEEFPHFGRAWHFHAQRREGSRLKFVRRCLLPADYMTLAAARIQQNLRLMRLRDRTKMGNVTSTVSGRRTANGMVMGTGSDRIANTILNTHYFELQGSKSIAPRRIDLLQAVTPWADLAEAERKRLAVGQASELQSLRNEVAEVKRGVESARSDVRAGLSDMRAEFGLLRQELLAAVHGRSFCGTPLVRQIVRPASPSDASDQPVPMSPPDRYM